MRSPMAPLAVLAVLVLASFAVPLTDATTQDAEDLRRAVHFREEFGLRSDLPWIEAVAQDPTSLRNWGVPLTPVEQADIDRRRDRSTQMGRLQEYVETLPELGSVYFDQVRGGMIVVAIAGDPEPHRQAIASRVPPGSTFELRQVQHPLAELNELQDQVAADRDTLATLGVNVNAVKVDEVGNRVEIGIDNADSPKVALLEARYGGDRIRVFSGGRGILTHDGCYGRGHCMGPPLRAGIVASPTNCSLGFVVNHSSQRRILTAGHDSCYFAGQFWHHGPGGNIGTIGGNRSWFGGDTYETADAASIGPLTAAQDQNWVYRTASQVNYILSSAVTDMVGDPVCISARVVDPVRCGTIVQRDEFICFPEGCLEIQREATYELHDGDSGGAVWNGGGVAHGVQSSCIDNTGNGECEFGNTADNALYSFIGHVFSELGGSMSIYTGD